MTKGLKLKVKTFWGLISTFVEVTEEKLVGGIFGPFPILNMVDKVAGLDLFLYPLKTKIQSFSNVFMEYRKRPRPVILFEKKKLRCFPVNSEKFLRTLMG